jgi:hypothetical protein
MQHRHHAIVDRGITVVLEMHSCRDWADQQLQIIEHLEIALSGIR